MFFSADASDRLLGKKSGAIEFIVTWTGKIANLRENVTVEKEHLRQGRQRCRRCKVPRAQKPCQGLAVEPGRLHTVQKSHVKPTRRLLSLTQHRGGSWWTHGNCRTGADRGPLRRRKRSSPHHRGGQGDKKNGQETIQGQRRILKGGERGEPKTHAILKKNSRERGRKRDNKEAKNF